MADPNSIVFATGGYDHFIKFWHPQDGVCYRTAQHPDSIPEADVAVHSVHIDPDAAYLAAVNSKGVCYIWSLTSGTGTSPITLIPRSKISAHHKYALKCCFSPDSSLLATTSADGSCKVWSAADLSLRNTLKKSSEKWVWDCAFSCDSQYIFTASSDHVARLWHVDHPTPIREYQGHSKAITCLAYSDVQR